jgi:hypothetical protein
MDDDIATVIGTELGAIRKQLNSTLINLQRKAHREFVWVIFGPFRSMVCG